MVHRTDLSLSQAIDGYLLPALAARLSEHTIADNQNGFRKLQAFLGQDTVFSKITVQQLREFVADLAKPRAPAGVAARPAKPLSKKTCLNIHAALSALWTWAVREGLAKLHLMHMVERPDPEQRAIVPLSQAEIKALLAATRRTQGYSRPGKKACDNRRAT